MSMLFSNVTDLDADCLEKQELATWLCRLCPEEVRCLSLVQLRSIRDIVCGEGDRVLGNGIFHYDTPICDDRVRVIVQKNAYIEGAAVRVLNILNRNGYVTVGKLLKLDGESARIRKMRNCGEKSAQIIECVIADIKTECEIK